MGREAECTSGLCLARSIDEVDWACAAAPACIACRFQTSLRPNGDYTDDPEVLRPTPGEAKAVWPTPPYPPASQGGERKAACAQQRRSFRHSTVQPSQHQLCTAPGSPSQDQDQYRGSDLQKQQCHLRGPLPTGWTRASMNLMLIDLWACFT